MDNGSYRLNAVLPVRRGINGIGRIIFKSVVRDSILTNKLASERPVLKTVPAQLTYLLI
jgi:hypothetical protein